MNIRIPQLLAGLVALALPLQAQVSAGGQPLLLDHGRLQPVSLEAPDHDLLLAEDESAPKDEPLRFGWPLDLELDVTQDGILTLLDDGRRCYELELRSPGARSLNFVYDEWRLVPGAEFFVIHPDEQQHIGAFTEYNNKPDGGFATQPLPGERAILQLIEPAGAEPASVVSVSRMVHGYRSTFAGPDELRNFGDSGSCNNNVACPEGEPWEAEIRSVAMILTGGGFRICSGAMVNNHLQDQTQYFLTADHCLGGETSWIFMFNYQSPSCSNVNGPTTDTVQGAILRASNSASDFALLELTETIPEEYGIVYAGWSAVDEASPTTTGIHHPSGDIKKISFDEDPVTSDRYLGNSGVANSHWKVTQWDDGTTEGGSSGSPLFDEQHRIMGQLHGGYASCSSLTADWYGKVSMSWDYGGSASSRLQDWLDPLGSGQRVLDAFDPAATLGLVLDGIETSLDDDGDGVLEPGESFQLAISLANTLVIPAQNITGLLSTSTSWLQIDQDQSLWPFIPEGGSAVSSPVFELQVTGDAPAVGEAQLTLGLVSGEESMDLHFTLSIGQRGLYWSDDVEGDGTGWSHSAAPDWSDAWHLSTEDAFDGVQSWKCGSEGTGDYPSHADARLETEFIELLPWSRLLFQQRIEAEVSGAFPDSAYDGGVLEISADNSLTWQQLFPVGGYSHAFRGSSGGGTPATHPFPGETPCWSGSSDWTEVVVDLAEWAGSNVRFRFRFGSDNGRTAEGWYLDDFRLEGHLDSAGLQPVDDLRITYLGGGYLQLQWTAASGADSYRVESRAGAGPWLEIALAESTEVQVQATQGLHRFRVIALAP